MPCFRTLPTIRTKYRSPRTPQWSGRKWIGDIVLAIIEISTTLLKVLKLTVIDNYGDSQNYLH